MDESTDNHAPEALDLEAIRKRHAVPMTVHMGCAVPGPCDAVALADEVERLSREVHDVRGFANQQSLALTLRAEQAEQAAGQADRRVAELEAVLERIAGEGRRAAGLMLSREAQLARAALKTSGSEAR